MTHFCGTYMLILFSYSWASGLPVDIDKAVGQRGYTSNTNDYAVDEPVFPLGASDKMITSHGSTHVYIGHLLNDYEETSIFGETATNERVNTPPKDKSKIVKTNSNIPTSAYMSSQDQQYELRDTTPALRSTVVSKITDSLTAPTTPPAANLTVDSVKDGSSAPVTEIISPTNPLPMLNRVTHLDTYDGDTTAGDATDVDKHVTNTGYSDVLPGKNQTSGQPDSPTPTMEDTSATLLETTLPPTAEERSTSPLQSSTPYASTSLPVTTSTSPQVSLPSSRSPSSERPITNPWPQGSQTAQAVSTQSAGKQPTGIMYITIGPFTFLEAVGILAIPLALAIICTVCVCLCAKRKKRLPQIKIDTEELVDERLVESQLPEANFHRLPFAEWKTQLDVDYESMSDPEANKRTSFHSTFGFYDGELSVLDECLSQENSFSNQDSARSSGRSSPVESDWTTAIMSAAEREGYMDMRKTSTASMSPTNLHFSGKPRSALTNSTSALYAVPQIRRGTDYIIPSPLQNCVRQSSSENILNGAQYDVPRRYRCNTGPSVPNRHRHIYQRPGHAGLHTRVPSPLVGYSPANNRRAKAASPYASPPFGRRRLASGDNYAMVDKSRKQIEKSSPDWRSQTMDGYVEPRKYTCT